MDFTAMTGDQILQNRKADKEYSWERKVIQFKDWLIERGEAEKTASTASMVVRGFFSYYRVPLQFRRSEASKLSQGQPKYEDYRFSREDLKKMCDVADLTEQYVITAGKSFGFRAGDFLRLTRSNLETYLDRPVPINIGEYTTQKEKVKAYPFIDGDAYPIIKLMIEKMDREGRKDPNEKVLTYSHQIQLSRVLQRVADNAGIKYGNKRVRFHCLRKFLIDRLASHMSESKWKQIVGKKISESAYVSPDSLREDYNRAMVETCFMKESEIADLKKRQEAMEQLMQGLTPDQKETMAKHGIRLTKRKNVKDCTDGIHCGESFEQINETQLFDYLRNGWQIVHRFSDGHVIMKR